MEKILVIDDDLEICTLLQRFLSRKGYEVMVAHSGAEGIKKAKETYLDLVLTDFRLGDMEGYDVLKMLLEINQHLPILVMTGYSDIKTAVNVIQKGALDYITKPLVPDEILLSIKIAMDTARMHRNFGRNHDNDSYEKPSSASPVSTKMAPKKISKNHLGYVIGESPAAQNLYRQIDLVAPTNFSVIIYGESGAGKESVARLIHDRSTRSKQPFISMDCGAISKDLANSELFGHEKGAFTGAISAKEGHFEMANGGTLFFDEISNLPYEVQVSLLRVVQERKVKRIGGSKEIPVDVRIIIASNERLLVSCRKGKFREDLFHRFNEFSIDLPPLRDRKDDILLFAHRFLQETSEELNRNISGFSPEVEQILLDYPWYGNVRELKNIIKRATLLTETNLVLVQALPFEITYHKRLGLDDVDTLGDFYNPESIPHPSAPNRNILPSQPYSEPTSLPQPATLPAHTDLKSAAQTAEYHRIIQALQESRYNKTKAAELLGVDRKTLYNKLKAYNIT